MIENSTAAIYRQALNKTFANALNGIRYFFKTERNGKIQASVAVFVLLAGFYFRISAIEWIFILLCTGAVLALEMLNSAIERSCDLIDNRYNPAIKIIKDVSAGAVLFTSVISILVGLIIFVPKIFVLL